MAERLRQRVDGLVITEVGDEILIYDELANSLHNLDDATARVWRAVDVAHTIMDVITESNLPEDSVSLALAQLSDAGLIYGYERTESTASRRRFMKKAGIVAIPSIVSITAPLAAAQASCGPVLLPPDSECTPLKDCCDPGPRGLFYCVPLSPSVGLCQM